MEKMKNFLCTLVENITLNKILVAVAVFIFVMILGTTIAVKAKSPVVPVVKAEPQKPLKDNLYSYKNLGRIRAVTAPEKDKKSGTTVVLTPLISYTKDDKEFFEELSRKNAILKSIFVNYFSARTTSQLKSKTDQKLKTELLSELNEILVLNKIQDIYFEDLIFLD